MRMWRVTHAEVLGNVDGHSREHQRMATKLYGIVEGSSIH